MLWGFLIAAAAFVVMITYGRLPAPQGVSVTPTEPPADTLQILNAEVDAFLLHLGHSEQDLERAPFRGVVEIVVPAAFPSKDEIQKFKGHLDGHGIDFSVDEYLPGQELRVFSGPALMARLYFRPPVQQAQAPLVSIIMDDIGRNLVKVRRVLALESPVTLAILPSTPYAFQAAELAHAEGQEVMVHIPMEPQGYPAIEPGRDALLLQHDAWEVRRRLEEMFQRVPNAAGGNNHMGSRYTEFASGMDVVGAFMAEKGLFFVDSRTTGNTLADKAMRQHRVPVVSRDVFLDNVKDVDAIRGEIRRLFAIARKHGRAVGICHPYEETIVSLELELPQLARSGVVVVPVSRLIAAAHLGVD